MFRFILLITCVLQLLKVSLAGSNPENKKFWIGNSSISIPGSLQIVAQPTDQADCKGNKTVFSVMAEGGIGKLHYQWKRKRPEDSGFLVFGAADSLKLAVYNIGVGNEAPDGTFYQVIVSDQNSSVVSASALLTVNQITGIAPVGVATYNMNQGDNLWFKVLTSGNAPLAYQWIKRYSSGNWRDLSDNSIVSGSQHEQLNFTGLSLADSGLYKLRVTFPTINNNQCIETSSITRKINVKPAPDNQPPVFLLLQDEYISFCPADLALANWNDATGDISPARIDSYRLPGHSTQFNIPIDHFSDNVTQSSDLILHWGIIKVGNPMVVWKDEAGNLLNDWHGQISLHPENIDFPSPESGAQNYRITFWLEDIAGNLTPEDLRHQIELVVLHRPEISRNF
jgi:hypothetical protein